MAHSTSDRNYFQCHRESLQLIARLPDSYQFDSKVETIAQHIKIGNTTTAIEELRQLRDSFREAVKQLCLMIRENQDRIYKADIEIMILKQRELEHARIVAEWQGDQEAIQKFDKALVRYDDFFAADAAITDLDPEAVVVSS